jgi:aspartate aminotransferase
MVAQRAREAAVSGIRRMFDAGPPDSVNLGLGEPDFQPPPATLDAMCEAVQNGANHYGPTAGLAPLRERVAETYRDLKPDTSIENVIVTCGASEGLMACALALYDPGDEVLVPDPGFVLYGPQARLVGARPVPYALEERNGFLPDLDALEAQVTVRTRAIVVNSPSNPTGSVLPKATVDALCTLAERHDLTIVSDEVYDRITYETPATSFWGRTDRAVVVNSFSKTLAATGWRVGFLLATPSLAVEINKMHYYLMACPSTPVQHAVLAGYGKDLASTRAMVREFRARRDMVVRELGRMPGISCVRPVGAFYAFPRFSWTRDAADVAQALLDRGVIMTPGDVFGSRGARHIRISFAASRDDLAKGLGILREYADELASS